MRVLEPFFNKNNDPDYSRLKNVAKEILAMQGIDISMYRLIC